MLRQEQADFSDPEEHAAWVTGALLVNDHDTITLHPRDAATISRQLWQAGFRHHPELQTHRFFGVTDGLAVGAHWREIDDAPEPLRSQATADAVPVEKMSLAARVALLERLRETGVGAHDEAPPEESHAVVLGGEP